jgi:uncharacterized membrane protein YgdD (TMEM256/DUF423 family)
MAHRNALAAASGCSAVLLGAFGAHGLKGIDPSLLATWNTAAHYHLIHSLALLYVSRLGGAASSLTYNLFACGITLFSGSLYLLVLTRIKPLGAVTPIGGLLLAGAWASLAL